MEQPTINERSFTNDPAITNSLVKLHYYLCGCALVAHDNGYYRTDLAILFLLYYMNSPVSYNYIQDYAARAIPKNSWQAFGDAMKRMKEQGHISRKRDGVYVHYTITTHGRQHLFQFITSLEQIFQNHMDSLPTIHR